MALSYPYTLDFLAKCLLGERIPLTLQRNDERSGSGDGRFWSAELARPLWTASYSLYAHDAAKSRELNAKVWGLDGMSKSFLWADPYYKGPAFGDNSGLGAVTVDAVRANRTQIGLAGLPEGFVATTGDYITILGPIGQVYFGQFLETSAPVSGGTIFGREVRPTLPFWVSHGDPVELVRPYFKAIVTDFQPFTSTRWNWGDSASITVLQKLP